MVTLAHRIKMKRQLLRTMQMIYELVVHCEERKGVSWSNLSGFKATLTITPIYSAPAYTWSHGRENLKIWGIVSKKGRAFNGTKATQNSRLSARSSMKRSMPRFLTPLLLPSRQTVKVFMIICARYARTREAYSTSYPKLLPILAILRALPVPYTKNQSFPPLWPNYLFDC